MNYVGSMRKIEEKLWFILKEKNWRQADLAEALGVAQASVSRWFSGSDPRGEQRDKINEIYAEIVGNNEKSLNSYVPLMGYIGAGAEIMPDFEQVPPDGLEKIEIPFPIPDDMVAFSVKGDSMLPVYKDGYIIIVYRDQRKSIESFYGQEAAVRTSDGKRFIKTIMRGIDGVNLFSWNAAPIENVKLEWIGEIFAVLPRQPSFLKNSLPNRL